MWTNLKQAIDSVIRTNDNQEITGAILNNTLKTIVDTVGANATYAGIATPSTNPGTPDGPVFYFALQGGTYTNFSAATVAEGLTVLFWDGITWSATSVFDKENMREVYDISAANSGRTYADLAAALDSNNGGGVPQSFRKGGMSIKFIQSSDQKYVQWRYMGTSIADANFVNVANWQGVDDEPTVGSKNIPQSGGVASLYGHYINNSEFVEVQTDVNGRILESRDVSGKKTINTDLEVKGNILNSAKGKSLVDMDFASSLETISHPDWYEVTIDENKRILEGINIKGERVINIPIVSPSLNALKGNVLNGKKYAFCGDSFTAALFNAITDSQGRIGMDSPELYDQTRKMWKSYGWWIIDRNNMSYYNDGVSGSSMTAVYSGGVIQNTTAFCYQRYLNIPSDTDYLTLMFGLNETAVEIGDETSNDDSTLWGAYNKVLTYFFTERPSMKIGIIISDAWLIGTPVADAIKAIAKYWGIPYLDMGGDERVPMRINGKSYPVSPVAKSLRNARFRISSEDAHPNQYAHEYMSTYVENFLRTL